MPDLAPFAGGAIGALVALAIALATRALAVPGQVRANDADAAERNES